MFCRTLGVATCVSALCSCIALAQSGQFFPPTANGDGIRFPLVYEFGKQKAESLTASAYGVIAQLEGQNQSASVMCRRR